MAKPCLWLRCETKELERRAALTPTTAKRLLDAGFDIFVERDAQRMFDDSEYQACVYPYLLCWIHYIMRRRAGCILVANNSWATAPTTATIIGLKELEESMAPLRHTHIQFAHCYKNQAGWASVLSRFHRGGGTLYDLEFLTDASGRRVAAFGFYAGFAGAAAGALALSAQKKGGKLGHLQPFENEDAMIGSIKRSLGRSGKGVRALVIGALGRCGRGAVDLFRKIGLEEFVSLYSLLYPQLLTVRRDDIIKWDMPETAKGGPFPEILDVDIFVNCIYLNSSIPSFLPRDQLIAAGSQRKLAVVVDVSCDLTNPFNPLPIYRVNTTFSEPTVAVDVGCVSFSSAWFSSTLIFNIGTDHTAPLSR
jgi:saccharopine dehydrogenase (NAD+, L-lysine-forming)